MGRSRRLHHRDDRFGAAVAPRSRPGRQRPGRQSRAALALLNAQLAVVCGDVIEDDARMVEMVPSV
jgi:hypothetical protein